MQQAVWGTSFVPGTVRTGEQNWLVPEPVDVRAEPGMSARDCAMACEVPLPLIFREGDSTKPTQGLRLWINQGPPGGNSMSVS